MRGEWQGKLSPPHSASRATLRRLSSPGWRRAFIRRPRSRWCGIARPRNTRTPDGTTTKAVEHRAGWDATFSAPKSVSLTALVGGDDRVREAHRAAVTTALDELERYTQARIGGNNPAETTGKFIAAKFEHDTARPVDGYAAPQLHTHAVIFNVTERADGSTRALQERAFFESQQYATAVYQSALTYQLRSLGYEIESGRSGAPEIKGYSQEYLDASSPRLGRSKSNLKRPATAAPKRRRSRRTPPATGSRHFLRKKFLRRTKRWPPLSEISLSRSSPPPANGHYGRTKSQSKRPSPKKQSPSPVTVSSSVRLWRTSGQFSGTLSGAAWAETSYRDIRQEFDKRRNAGEFRSVQGMKHDSARSFTTPETIAAERANIRYVLEGRNAVEPIMTAERARGPGQHTILF